jgi:ecotin
MKKIFTTLFLIIGLISFSQNKPSYPEPKEGFKRVDLLLPKLKNDENLQVEIKFAFEIEMLDCERGSFSIYPNIPIEKFGIGSNRFPFYILENDNAEISVGNNGNCGDEKKMKKIYSNQNITYNYQSSYAVPFYIPKNWSLVYRVWSTTDTYTIVK